MLNGAYLPASEIESSVAEWNGVPVTVGHPMVNGEYISANRPNVLDQFQIGRIFNVQYNAENRALRGEAWVDITRADALGGNAMRVAKVLARHATGSDSSGTAKLLEVSTGYWHEEHQQAGSFNGERYREVQQSLLPDHLAILPNKRGGCSVQDGCGTPRTNQLAVACVSECDCEADDEQMKPVVQTYTDGLAPPKEDPKQREQCAAIPL